MRTFLSQRPQITGIEELRTSFQNLRNLLLAHRSVLRSATQQKVSERSVSQVPKSVLYTIDSIFISANVIHMKQVVKVELLTRRSIGC